ncbi:MAG: hypothetical protein NC079_05740 [Clostridium sp.]|nr:hypothetical protein [Acetatifactor muris]MCM1528017.1 hypothetical protein [Bacteroides sp.]MCM1563094.1 hypothetical protein [Clostridium sp.]
MKKSNLFRIELYRFFHSISIMKYAVLIPLLLFFMSYINLVGLESELTGKTVWASMAPDFLYLLAFICTIIAVYVGREFRHKTICYEIMSGHTFCEIALSKTMSCGMIIPVVMVICMMVYLLFFPIALCEDFYLRIFCLLLFFLHVCSCTVLYVILCRSSVIGGVFAFIKFLVIETVLQLTLFKEGAWIKGLLVLEQWYRLLNIEESLSKELVISILTSIIAEYGILQGMLLWHSKRQDM